jgi:hypothetical protein
VVGAPPACASRLGGALRVADTADKVLCALHERPTAQQPWLRLNDAIASAPTLPPSVLRRETFDPARLRLLARPLLRRELRCNVGLVSPNDKADVCEAGRGAAKPRAAITAAVSIFVAVIVRSLTIRILPRCIVAAALVIVVCDRGTCP